MNIILASRTLVTVNLLNSSVVYIKTASEIISIARTSLNKSCLSSFLHGQKFRPWLCHEDMQELQPHSQSHLFRISSSEKLSPSASVIMTTTTLATCFEGLIPHEIFSWLDTNSKVKHKLFELTPSGFLFAALAVDIASHTRFKAASLFTMFTVKQLQDCVIVYKHFQCRNVQEMQRSIVKHCTPRSQIMWNVTLNSPHTSSYIINVDQNKKRKQSPRMRRRDCNLPLRAFDCPSFNFKQKFSFLYNSSNTFFIAIERYFSIYALIVLTPWIYCCVNVITFYGI